MTYRGRAFKGRGMYQGKVTGQMRDSRVAWVDLLFGKIIVRQFLPEDEKSDEMREFAEENQVGATIVLEFQIRWMSRALTLNLTNLTHQEILLMRRLLNMALDLAEPVVIDRDKVAQDAKEAGDDSYARVYRAVPQIVVRESKIVAHGPGLLRRSKSVPGGSQHGPSVPDGGSGVGHGGGVHGAGDGVADEESADAGSTHDGPEADQP